MSLKFPKSFKFGAADADLQVIGEANTLKYENSEPTMWNYFAKNSGKCFNNESPDVGIDRYHLYEKDVEIMKRLGLHHYRTSISMARTLKENGEVNKIAIDWYKKYFSLLRKSNIRIYATLYHWELPQYLNKMGGWKNLNSAEVLTKHARTVVNNLGEYIDEYFIFNESRHASIRSYYEGIHAPGERNLKNALLAAHNILIAHGLVYKTLIEFDKNLKIGTVLSLSPSYAYSTNEKDILAAKYSDGAKNLWFTDPFFLGKYPEFMIELYGKNMPAVSKEDMKLIRIGDKLSTVGVNYYKGSMVKYSPKNKRKFEEISLNEGLKNDLGWPIYLPPYYPEGLYDILQQLYFSYKTYSLKKIYVTENGMAQNTPWNGKNKIIYDDRRIYYFREHIKQVHKAITRGIPVEGYFAWTLMDNYEWVDGYRPESCFGLIHVDRKNMKRIPKKSAYWYKTLISTHTLT